MGERQINNKPPDVFFKERSRNQYVTLEHVHTFSQRLLNTLRVSFARSTSEASCTNSRGSERGSVSSSIPFSAR